MGEEADEDPEKQDRRGQLGDSEEVVQEREEQDIEGGGPFEFELSELDFNSQDLRQIILTQNQCEVDERGKGPQEPVGVNMPNVS